MEERTLCPLRVAAGLPPATAGHTAVAAAAAVAAAGHTSAKTSVLAHAVFQGFTCWNFFNMPEFKFPPALIFFIPNGMFKPKMNKQHVQF